MRLRATAGRAAAATLASLTVAILLGDAATGQIAGRTTVEQRIVPNGAPGFRQLGLGPGEPYVIRQGGLGEGEEGRARRRVSLVHIGQLSDFQLADEESPARVEIADFVGPPVDAAWRPHEALNPQIDETMVRQLNTFAKASPLRGAGGRRPMDLVLNTGDLADNQQRNETLWVRTLLEGGPLDPNSGVDPSGTVSATCPPGLAPGAAEAARYTGVQDYHDYVEGPLPYFYDPDLPRGEHAEFPAHPGLMDRAQQPFAAAGLEVPSYVSFGNHDALAQGNQAYNTAIEQIATGCIKPMAGVPDPANLADALANLNPATAVGLFATDPANVLLVPPDPARQAVSKRQYMDIFRSGSQRDGHGFGLLDPGEVKASGGAAGYYALSPVKGLRLISLDTVSEGGVTGPSASGNIDHPQYLWLEGQLESATERDQLVVLFSHHAIQSLDANIADELAPPCTAPDSHGHDLNPGCDLDPRSSTPLHLGADLTTLLHRYPHVIAWIAGHSHVNDIVPFAGEDHGFWMIRTAAEADWPQQSRLVEIFDNRDGTLSIFGTILDHVAPASAPAPGTPAEGMGLLELASLGRTIAYNDHQVGARERDPACGEGEAEDRNVELLIDDPRRVPPRPKIPKRCGYRDVGTDRGEKLKGTRAGDDLSGLGGDDRINGRDGHDCLRGGRGDDRLRGGEGRDKLEGGPGRDKLKAADGQRDEINCGAGRRDSAVVDHRDGRARGCENVRRSGNRERP